MKRWMCWSLALLVVGAPQATQALHLGGEMKIEEVTPIAELSAHPERWFNRNVRVEGIISSASTQEGCFIEIVPASGPGEGILVTFADSDLKLPKDCTGKHVVAEGMFYQKIYPASRVAHWQEHSFRKGKVIPPFSLIKRLQATAADIGEETAKTPPAGEIMAADTSRVDLAVMEFESDGFGTGRKVLQPGEVTERHSTGRMRELIFCLDGTVAVELNRSERVTLGPGEMTYIPPATEHEVRNAGTGPSIYLFVFSKAPEPTDNAKTHAH